MTRAIILAAGKGTRLRPLTIDRPKCLVDLFGKSILERQIKTMQHAGIKDILIVGGYQFEELQKTGYDCINNTRFEDTNMVHSLFCARDFMNNKEELIISYGDIVYQEHNLEKVLLGDGDISLMIDIAWLKYWELRFDDPLSDAETLIMDENYQIKSLGEKTSDYSKIQGQYTGLIKVKASKINEFISFGNREDFSKQYMTYFIQALINAHWNVKAINVKNGWLEVDTVRDMQLYEQLDKTNVLSQFYIKDV